MQWFKDDDHDIGCKDHPYNRIDSSYLWPMTHRDGTIWGFLVWLFDPMRCNAKVTKLQEALDRL